MLIPNHPNDERLSALASRETDATADATLTAHVASCHRCTELVNELDALRAALADLPDLAPSRPLRLLPLVEAPSAGAADRLGGWARRFFAPVLASGAALALVGTIGTAAPGLSGMAQSGAAPSEPAHALQVPAGEPAASAAADGAPESAASNAPDESAASAAPAGAAADSPASGETRGAEDLATPNLADSGGVTAVEEPSSDPSTLGFDDADQPSRDTLTVERSPWPMVLFTGVALMIGALLLRWILVPRAG
jgi:hypothetical protein